MQALSHYDEIVHRFPDLAITEYARIHRAIFLYQTGNASRAILELEDEEVNMRGLAEAGLHPRLLQKQLFVDYAAYMMFVPLGAADTIFPWAGRSLLIMRMQVHAALACILHAERPREVWRAESQWEIASEFDTRFGDVQWVQAEKHWPPRLLAALQSFLNLA